MTLNDVFDVEWDKEHAAERPIASGNLSFRAAFIVCLIEFIGGIVLVLWKTSFRIELLIVLIAAILFYNWIHKRWAGSVIVMGICRAMVYLGAASAVAVDTNMVEIPGVVGIVAVAMIIYISGLTLAARSERNSDGSKGWPKPGVRLMLMLPVLFPLLAAREIPQTPADIFRHASVVVGVVGIWAWLSIVRSALGENIPKGIAFAIAGIALYDAAIVAFADWRAGIVCVCAFLLTLVAQRYIPAT
jgi:4-hydroxybenzoate polyprenyltransferase